MAGDRTQPGERNISSASPVSVILLTIYNKGKLTDWKAPPNTNN